MGNNNSAVALTFRSAPWENNKPADLKGGATGKLERKEKS
jgi:hypothetical protein